MIKFNQLKPVRLSGGVAVLWAVMMAAVVAALLGGSVPAANADTTPATSAVSVIPNATGGTALLTATRVGIGSTYQLTTAALHVNPLPSSSDPQSVDIGWELQSLATGPNATWTKVQWVGAHAGLYSVSWNDDDEYTYVPLTGGTDVQPVQFYNRVVAHEGQALRVVATVTWTNHNTGEVLGTVTLTPTKRADLSCQNATANKCRVSLDPRNAGILIKLLP